jgi:hypothetical protein
LDDGATCNWGGDEVKELVVPTGVDWNDAICDDAGVGEVGHIIDGGAADDEEVTTLVRIYVVVVDELPGGVVGEPVLCVVDDDNDGKGSE